MWCPQCQVQYCLHCGDKMGSLVKWHREQSCKQYLEQVSRSKAEAERQQKARLADEECAFTSFRAHVHDSVLSFTM